MSIIFNSLSRKQWFIIAAAIAVLVLGIFALLFDRSSTQDNPNVGKNENTVLELAYCTDEQVKPCVVSFGMDMDGNMLVNILLPDLTFPGFYLEIVRGEVSVSYACKKNPATPNNAYCIGEKLPPGESLHLMLLSTRDDVPLAQGNLSIIGFAFPTLEIAIPTVVHTDVSVTPELTGTPDFILPTSTQLFFPTKKVLTTPTETPPGYPNPSYP